MQPDAAGYLPNGRPTTERLLADAEERLELAEQLPAKMAAIRGWAVNAPGNLRVTTNSLGEIVDLNIAEEVMRADPRALSAEILRLAGEAFRAATAAAIDQLAPVLGDEQALEMARATGLGDRIEPDAPVVPWHDGGPIAPESMQQPTGSIEDDASSANWQQDDDITAFDFTQFRSDR
jgi:hypothetical protein